jgi:aromatic-amino-acid transaminase
MKTTSFFANVPTAAPDVILGVTEAFRNDASPQKVNLGVGVYQDGTGRIPVLQAIKHAAKQWLELEDSKTYLPIDGLATYNSATQDLLFGKNSRVVADKRVTTVQSVGGSGALKLGAELIRRFLPSAAIYISDPSWENHRVVFEAAGLKVETYPYYDPSTSGLKRSEMLETFRKLPPGSAVLLHACCHNPTGVDLDMDTWREVIDICAERQLLPFLDFAYQGFADGNEQDAAPIRMFADKGLTFIVSNSYAKSFSMYRERCGALSVVTGSAKETAAVLSQLKRVVRSIYSSPPSYGAQLISLVLNSPELHALWERELGEMRERIHSMRRLFCSKLATAVTNRDFSFILKQRGMFSYSGLSAEMVRSLRDRYHIYAIESGRICVAAINEGNVDYICQAISGVISKP